MDGRSLNRRVTIQQLVDGQDAIGQPGMVWEDVASVWANVRYLNGTETVKADSPVSVAKASIRIRRRAGITAGMRATLGTTYFDIKAVLPDEVYRDRVDLACETGANNG